VRSRRRWALAAAGVVALLAVLLVAAGRDAEGPEAQPLPDGPLAALGEGRDLLVGTAVRDEPLRREDGYREVLQREFSSVTPENAMKWEVLQAEPGAFDFERADAIVAAARDAGQQVRGHTLVWHNQLPEWVAELSAAEMREALREHVQTVVRRYRGRVARWDVVNEPIDDDGSLRASPFLETLGPGYIADAYRFAREADPDAELWLNDFGVEGGNPKSDAYLELARELRDDGVPLDGVGFQSHVNLDGVPPTFEANLERFATLGLDIAITEADVRLREPVVAAQLELQGRVFAQLVAGCRATARCTEVTFWGFTDRHSWIPGNEPGYGAATLLDDRLGAKPAYGAVSEALRTG
jgi:endo-1,4-beta-xylanase